MENIQKQEFIDQQGKTEAMLRRAAQLHQDAGALWDQWWQSGDASVQQEVLRKMEEVIGIYRELGPEYEVHLANALLEYDTAHFGCTDYDFQSVIEQAIELGLGKKDQIWAHLLGRAFYQMAEWLEDNGDIAAAAHQLLAALAVLRAGEEQDKKDGGLYDKVLNKLAANPISLELAQIICAHGNKNHKTIQEILKAKS